jgi:glycosyltransferase involved in cell wall biosynthesis
MRVAVFTETFLPKTDGIVRVVCLLLDHLKKRGVDVLIVAPKLGDGNVTEYQGFPVVTVSGVTFPLYPELKIAPPGYFTYREVAEFKPDIAHFIHPIMIGIPGMMMAKYLGIPTLTSFHLDLARLAGHFNIGFMQPLTDTLTRLVFNWADYSLAPSKAIQREMIALGIKNVGLWGRGVDGDKFNPRFKNAAMRAQLSDGNPDDVLLVYVGRLSNEKQIDKLRPVLERVPNTRLAIVGDGPARADLEKHFAGLPVKFTGYMSGEPLSQAYASADIFAFPSALETFGLVVTEAMAAGLPVVASRVGGIPDVVEEGKTGYTFNVGDVDTLVEGVRKIASNPAKRVQMGLDARAFAATQTWDAMMDEVIEHYARLIIENQPSAEMSA